VDSKHVVIFNPLQPGHVTQRMRNVLWLFIQGNACLAYIGHLQPNISVTVAVRKKVSTHHL